MSHAAPLLAAVLGLAAALARPSGADAQVYAEELRVTGVWPDLEPAVGAGVGLDHALEDRFTARLRLGALWAHEPWIASAGISGELGALAGRGVGVELELDHFGGGWLSLSVSRVRGPDWMTRAALGFTLAGVEWQHRLDAGWDALLLVVRVPLGKWWFLLARDAAAPTGSRR